MMTYRHEIDGLRAIAVVAIMLFHTQNKYFSHGFIGVDIFFVISGYLITGLIVSNIEEKQFSVFGFYLKRAKRLLPALFLVMLACIPFAWLWMFSDQYKDFSQSLVAASVFGSNILFWLESQEYFTPSLTYRPLLHTWSLAVEEQFYIIYPLVLLLLLHYGRRFTVLGISLLTLIFFYYQLFFIHAPLTLHYMLQARAWLFGIGALAFFTRQKWLLGESLYSGYFAFLGISILMLMLVLPELESLFAPVLSKLPWTYISIACIVVVILFADAKNKIGQYLANPIIAGIGTISYSLYLWHYPIFVFARMRLLTVPMSLYFLLSIITVLISYLSWRFVEMPFRNNTVMSSKRFVSWCVGVAVLLVLIGAYGVKEGGYILGMSDVDTTFEPNYGLSPDCRLTNRAPECQRGGNPEILVWGDSFAMHSVNTILATTPDVSMIQFTFSGCSPLISKMRLRPNSTGVRRRKGRCSGFNENVLSSIEKWPSIKYVVISARFSGIFHRNYLEKLSEDDGKEYYQRVEENFIKLLDQIRTKGVVPIVISEPRRPPEEAMYCAAHSLKFEYDSSVCNFSSSAISDAQILVNQLLKRVSVAYKVIWLDDYICSGEQCITTADKTPLYNYTGHLSSKGALLIGTKLGVYQQIKAVKY